METQQMMELLLARMNASMKEHKQYILARMEAGPSKSRRRPRRIKRNDESHK
jgi:hypothetical protein